jgi:hypothetical protein
LFSGIGCSAIPYDGHNFTFFIRFDPENAVTVFFVMKCDPLDGAAECVFLHYIMSLPELLNKW